MKKLASLFLLLVASVGYTQIQFETLTWDEALNKSKKENKLIFINTCSTWSEPCQELSKYTFSDLEVGNFFNEHFINLNWNMEEYPAIEFSELFEVDLYPTLLFTNSKGEIVHRGCGALEPNELIGLAEVALSEQNLEYFESKLEGNKSEVEFVLSYFQLVEEACLNVEKEAKLFLDGIKAEDLSSETAFLVFEQYQWDIFSRDFQYVINNTEKFYSEYGKNRVNEKFFNTYYNQYVEIYESEELHLFAMRALLKEINNAKFGGADTLQLIANLHYSELIEDWESFGELVPKWIALNQVSDEEINDYAWKFYLFVEDKDKLELAVGWIKQLIDVEVSPSYIDTYASLKFKLGSKKEAVELEKQALDLAKEMEESLDHYEYQLRKFQMN